MRLEKAAEPSLQGSLVWHEEKPRRPHGVTFIGILTLLNAAVAGGLTVWLLNTGAVDTHLFATAAAVDMVIAFLLGIALLRGERWARGLWFTLLIVSIGVSLYAERALSSLIRLAVLFLGAYLLTTEEAKAFFRKRKWVVAHSSMEALRGVADRCLRAFRHPPEGPIGKRLRRLQQAVSTEQYARMLAESKTVLAFLQHWGLFQGEILLMASEADRGTVWMLTNRRLLVFSIDDASRGLEFPIDQLASVSVRHDGRVFTVETTSGRAKVYRKALSAPDDMSRESIEAIANWQPNVADTGGGPGQEAYQETG
jgi:hypothetical protein